MTSGATGNSRHAPTLPESRSRASTDGSARTIVRPHVASPSRIAHDSDDEPPSPRMPGCGIHVVQRSQTVGGTTSFRKGQKITSGPASSANRSMSSGLSGGSEPQVLGADDFVAVVTQAGPQRLGHPTEAGVDERYPDVFRVSHGHPPPRRRRYRPFSHVRNNIVVRAEVDEPQ